MRLENKAEGNRQGRCRLTNTVKSSEEHIEELRKAFIAGWTQCLGSKEPDKYIRESKKPG